MELRETKHLFLLQSKLAENIEQFALQNKEYSDAIKNLIKGRVSNNLEDRCLTRDIKWGIPVPEDGWEGKVFYVWFDAPLAYISFLLEQNKDWNSYHITHFIGKDNLEFHAVSFPSYLHANKQWKVPEQIKVFNWLQWNNEKFSTSKGQGIFLDQALDLHPVNYWRWWLLTNSPENHDVNFSYEAFITECNQDLANGLGNLVARTTNLIVKHGFDNSVPLDENLFSTVTKLLSQINKDGYDIQIRKYCEGVKKLIRVANIYLNDNQPWNKDISINDKRNILFQALCVLKIIGHVIYPIIPGSAKKLLQSIGSSLVSWDDILTHKEFSIKEKVVLFSRLEQRY